MLFEPLEARQLLSYVPGGSMDMFFTGNHLPPQHAYVAQTDALLTAPAAGDKATIGLNYLKNNAANFGLTANDFNKMKVTSNYTSNGITHIYLQQTFNGLPIADANASVHIAANGQVISANANFVPGLPHPAVNTAPVPDISAEQAVNYYASATSSTLGQPINIDSTSGGFSQHTVITAPDLSDEPINLELQYVPRPDGDVTLGWKINVLTPGKEHWWDMTISAEHAEDGGMIINLADWVNNASYNVFARPVEDPLDGERTIAVDPHDANLASPLGWHDANGVPGPEWLDTRGNNVSAQEDRDADNTGGNRPASPTLDFDFPLTLPSHPFTFTDVTTTNVFYWMNLAHDVTYNHGFDEGSGNFQQVNHTGQGLGNDRVLADTQDPQATNNAFFGTPPDGQNGFSAYGLITISFSTFAPLVPPRDIGLDGTVVAHEYGHGVSNRLTGGPANANALNGLQSGGMGEGWSDWLALVMTAQPTDTRDTPQTVGEWATDTVGTGIRRNPYSFDMSIDPLTLGDYNGDLFPQFNSTEVHNSGEIWATALWDMTWLLIEKHGFNNDLYDQTGGLQVALDIVLEGMKLQPANPTFIEARNAILAADLAIYGGENYDEIWEAFARRGFGVSALIGGGVNANSNSLVVIEAFDRPTPLARVQGTVFQDVNGNARRDGVDLPLQGWTVYVDANNNAQFDVGEKSDISGVDGSYSLSFFTSEQARIRQVVQPGFTQTLPAGNGAYVISVPGRGQVVAGADFGNKELPGRISGVKFHDLNGDGLRGLDDPLTIGINEAEPGIQGIVIYVDLNNDSRIGILEPAAVTDINGRYTIANIQPGTYTIREVYGPGMVQTFPDPLGLTAGAHLGVIVAAGVTTPDIDFGNIAAIDWGDAPTAAQTNFPASYPTELANNGARHGILPGFGLGAAVDGEADGQPTLSANGDDATGAVDDEDGLVIPGFTPGTTANAMVTVRNGGFTAGFLQGWVDWNRDGDWNDANERVVTDLLLREQAAPHAVPITVPVGLDLGPTYARFRYGYERGNAVSPGGNATAGEVEDYVVVVLENLPVAIADCFGGSDPNCLPPIIKQGTAQNELDVLANDFGTINGGPFLHPADFPFFSDNGGLVELNATQDKILYTPDPNFIGADTFLYRIKDGAIPPNFSSPVRNTPVTVNVTAKDPKGIDDTVTIPFNATPVLAELHPQPGRNLTGPNSNDVSPDLANTHIVPGSLTRVTAGPPAGGELAQITTTGPNAGHTIDFRPGTDFKGTVIYQYQIDDNDPLTAPSSARVTIQVVDFVGGVPQPAPSHLAMLETQVLNVAGGVLANTFVGGEFLVRVVATDLGPDTFTTTPASVPRDNRGVESAYLDLLFNSSLAAPVSSANNPLGFVITFDGKTGTQATGGTQVATSTVQGAPSPAPTPTSFSGDLSLDFADNAYNGLNVVFTSGPLTGQRARILDYVGATRQIIVDHPFTAAPGVGNSFTIERALYNSAQTGTPNSPGQGAIDEVGGTHTDTTAPIFPTGAGQQVVFSARFIATGEGDLQVFGDPADLVNSDVILTNMPNAQPNELIVLTDEQVFLRPSSTLGISDGGGEFTNLREPLDVNDDGAISPIDALLVINDLNAHGSREISQYSIGSSGQLPAGYIDVNIDSFVAPVDALLVINFLNANKAPGSSFGPSFAPSGGEGEMAFAADSGEGEAGSANASAGNGAIFALLTSFEEESTTQSSLLESTNSESELCDVPLGEAIHSIVANLVGNIQSVATSPSSEEVDADSVLELVTSAVDELFARLACCDVLDFDPFEGQA